MPPHTCVRVVATLPVVGKVVLPLLVGPQGVRPCGDLLCCASVSR